MLAPSYLHCSGRTCTWQEERTQRIVAHRPMKTIWTSHEFLSKWLLPKEDWPLQAPTTWMFLSSVLLPFGGIETFKAGNCFRIEQELAEAGVNYKHHIFAITHGQSSWRIAEQPSSWNFITWQDLLKIRWTGAGTLTVFKAMIISKNTYDILKCSFSTPELSVCLDKRMDRRIRSAFRIDLDP